MLKRNLSIVALLGLTAFLPSCSDGETQATASAQDGHEGHDHDQGSVFEHYDASSPESSMQALVAGGSRSDLKFDYLESDLGRAYQHHTYDVEFPFLVDGPDPVVLTELDSSCGCTKVKIRPDWELEVEGESWPLNKEIPAGARGAISAVFDAARYQDEKASTITVRGNFLSRKIVLGVVAQVIPVFEVAPNVVQFGEVLAGALRDEDPSKIVAVTAMKEFEIKRWKRVPPGIQIEVLEDVKKIEDGRVIKNFLLTAGKDMPEGRMSSSVIAETDLGIDLEFLVNIDILGAVKYAPSSRVAFGIFDQGQTRRRTIKVEATRGAIKLPVPMVEIVGAAGDVMTASIETKTPELNYEIKLNVGKEAAAGSYNGLLKITYPEGSGIASKEIILNARIRLPR
ncbi:MAG: DUF1573 domain-containing protein [Planctomycetota bacterium]|jgi:hypothetical protein